MIESKFEYTESLIGKINTTAIKKYNIAIEVAVFIILLGAVILFVTSNIILGAIFSVIFVLLLISLFVVNKAILKSNRILIGQQVNIIFNESDMKMTTKLGNKVLYNTTLEYSAIKKVKEHQDLVFLYFDKTSAVIVPKASFKTNEEYQKAMEFVGNNYIVNA